MLAALEALQNDKIVARASADFDLTWLKISAAAIHERNLTCAGLKDPGSRNRQLSSQRGAELHIHEHSQRKLQFRIGDFETYFRGARGLVELGPDEADPSRKDAPGVGVHGNLRGVPHLDSTEVVLKNLGVYPHS